MTGKLVKIINKVTSKKVLAGVCAAGILIGLLGMGYNGKKIGNIAFAAGTSATIIGGVGYLLRREYENRDNPFYPFY